MKTTKEQIVYINRCSRCGDECHSLRRPTAASLGECPRCGNTFRPLRVIVKAHADTIARARREDAEDSYAEEMDGGLT